MKLSLFAVILLLNCCALKSAKNDLNKDIIFHKNMSFNEFKLKLNQYAIISSFPDIKE